MPLTERMMKRMKKNPRVRVTVTLPRDLVERLDRAAKGARASRSRVMEDWLRSGAHAELARKLEAETIAYYESMTADERAEEAAMAAAFARAAKRVNIDGPPLRPRRRRRA